jgi:hypothetical protein
MKNGMKTFIANMQHAARNLETVTIGGGRFCPAELYALINEIQTMDAKLTPKPKPVPWTLSPWMHIPWNDQFLIMQGDRIVSSMFTIGEADRERFARALTWLNEQEN